MEAQDRIVWTALNDFGRPVHSKDLEEKVGITSREVQHSINRLVLAGHPIGSSPNKGYYVILSERDWCKALDDLDSRVQELRARRNALFEYGDKRKWSQITQPDMFMGGVR